jgi:hypothetical protein
MVLQAADGVLLHQVLFSTYPNPSIEIDSRGNLFCGFTCVNQHYHLMYQIWSPFSFVWQIQDNMGVGGGPNFGKPTRLLYDGANDYLHVGATSNDGSTLFKAMIHTFDATTGTVITYAQ